MQLGIVNKDFHFAISISFAVDQTQVATHNDLEEALIRSEIDAYTIIR